jgi:hypothetical protein
MMDNHVRLPVSWVSSLLPSRMLLCISLLKYPTPRHCSPASHTDMNEAYSCRRLS